jgi:hypothetical protein
MASDKGKLTKFVWSDILKKVKENQGIDPTTVNHSFDAVSKEITSIISSNVPKAIGDNVLIKTPLCALNLRRLPEHVYDDGHKKWNMDEAIGLACVPPQDWVALANDGFDVKKKEIK